MQNTGLQPLTIILICANVLTGVGVIALLLVSRDASLKRRLYPPMLILSSVIFFSMVASVRVPWPFLLLSAPVLVVIVLLNLRNTKFCDACGQAVTNPGSIQPPTVCSKCGAALP